MSTVLESSGVEDAISTAKDSRIKIDLLLYGHRHVFVWMAANDESELVALRPNLKILYMSGYTDDVILHRGALTHRCNMLGPKAFYEEHLSCKGT